MSVGSLVDAPAKEHKARSYLRRVWGGKNLGDHNPSPAAVSPPRLQGAATATTTAAAVNQLTPASTAVTFAATVAKMRGREVLNVSIHAWPKLTPWRRDGGERVNCGQGVHGCHFGYGKCSLGSLLASNAHAGRTKMEESMKWQVYVFVPCDQDVARLLVCHRDSVQEPEKCQLWNLVTVSL